MCFYNGKHRKYGSYKSTENKKQMFFVPLEPTKKCFRRFITHCGSVFSVISQKLVFEIVFPDFFP